MKTFVVDDPNFSIIMPGGCNAACKFCFYKYKSNKELNKVIWLKELEKVINKLPNKFHQVSITGGEPTLDIENLNKTATLLRKHFNKVVLTTNGFGLSNLDTILKNRLVDCINISRHMPNMFDNIKVFKSTLNSKSTVAMKAFIEKSHMYGIPVTINCVVTPELNINEMIDWCNLVGAYAIKFREISSDCPIDKLLIDKELAPYKPIYKEVAGDI